MDLYKLADQLFAEDKGLIVYALGSNPGPFKINAFRQDYSDFTEWWRSLSKEKREKAVAYVKWLAKVKRRKSTFDCCLKELSSLFIHSSTKSSKRGADEE